MVHAKIVKGGHPPIGGAITVGAEILLSKK